MRVASQVLRFVIPVLVVVGLGADMVVIGVVSMVMGIDVLAVIGILAVGNVVVVNDGEVGYDHISSKRSTASAVALSIVCATA